MQLGTGVNIVACQAGQAVFLSRMQVMKILYAITEAGTLGSFFLLHQPSVVALKAEAGDFKPQQTL